ncbi:hypothetical protein M440DRAFT_1236397 [Trichoderma longibrachiatum ATCC 18648]|uniref:Uncharacterized protein n=1 Tax=Trichoderma longibrachiatum ATCC 18648 TaxID=983965 RepID=A0A2T4C5K1_TRILO|nr:hypothetical protein M440DRAFT_1236397 [Trichoderma longibrachiatum ATCC 18648]
MQGGLLCCDELCKSGNFGRFQLSTVRERRPSPALSTRDAGKRQQHKAKTGTRQGRKREGGVVLETTPVLMRDTDGRYALDRQSACVGARGGLGIAQEAWANENGMDGWMDGRTLDVNATPGAGYRCATKASVTSAVCTRGRITA